jgi:hypothetical protein
MKKLTLVIACLITIQSFAQTDIIELRSRNASLKKYALARVDEGDHVTSNFGVVAMEEVRNSVLDSVKCISDTKIVMYTSDCENFMVPFYRSTESGLTFQDGYQQVVWRPGADTVENHPLFSNRHSLDSIKMILDRDYYFRLPADSVKFIGFDNGAPIETEKSIDSPPKNEEEIRKSTIGWPLIFMLIGPLLCAYLFGFYLVPKTEH